MVSRILRWNALESVTVAVFKLISKRRTWNLISGAVFTGSLAEWVGLGEYYRVNAPWSPVEETGHIYSLAYHGTYAYLTWYEYIIYWALTLLCASVVIVGFLIDRYASDNEKNRDWRNPKLND